MVDKVEAVIDDWKKENPNGEVTIEMQDNVFGKTI